MPKICKKCGEALPDDRNDKLCGECREKRKNKVKKILFGLAAVGAVTATAVLAVLAGGNEDDSYNDDYDDDDFEECYARQFAGLSDDEKAEIYEQEEIAIELACSLGEGTMDEEEFENLYNQLDVWRQMEVDQAITNFADNAVGSDNW